MDLEGKKVPEMRIRAHLKLMAVDLVYVGCNDFYMNTNCTEIF